MIFSSKIVIIISVLLLLLDNVAKSLISNNNNINNINNINKKTLKLKSSYLDDLASFKSGSEKKCLVGFTTDAWNIGQRKYKEFLAVHKMVKKISKSNVAVIDIPMWEIAQGPHYDDLQRLFESFWIPDFTSEEHLLLQYNLIVIPDPVLAKYMVESYYEKEVKIEKKKAYYNKLIKQPWGVIENFPPKEKYEYERIKDLSKQKWIRKFPPIATCGEETYARMKNHAQIEYFSHGVEDFALYLPQNLTPSRRVLVLRFKNRFDTLVQSLVMKGINVTSAYPATWMRKDWSPQEERLAKEVDVVYFHENHAVREWRDRLGVRDKDPVAACHDAEVARAAKAAGFKDVFFAKTPDTEGLIKTVTKAVDFAKSVERQSLRK